MLITGEYAGQAGSVEAKLWRPSVRLPSLAAIDYMTHRYRISRMTALRLPFSLGRRAGAHDREPDQPVSDMRKPGP